MPTITRNASELMTDLTIWCDGGARNNQFPELRQAYGSWAAVRHGQKADTTYDGVREWQHKFTYGKETNNAAELMTCIKALEYLNAAQEAGWNKGFRLCLDSQLVICALKGVKKPAKQLEPLYNRVTELKTKIVWQLEVCKVDESQVKQILGH